MCSLCTPFSLPTSVSLLFFSPADGISVKKEKEDDYEFKSGVKEEKNSATETADAADENAETAEDVGEPTSDKSPADEPPVESEKGSPKDQSQEDADEVPPGAED